MACSLFIQSLVQPTILKICWARRLALSSNHGGMVSLSLVRLIDSTRP